MSTMRASRATRRVGKRELAKLKSDAENIFPRPTKRPRREEIPDSEAESEFDASSEDESDQTKGSRSRRDLERVPLQSIGSNAAPRVEHCPNWTPSKFAIRARGLTVANDLVSRSRSPCRNEDQASEPLPSPQPSPRPLVQPTWCGLSEAELENLDAVQLDEYLAYTFNEAPVNSVEDDRNSSLARYLHSVKRTPGDQITRPSNWTLSKPSPTLVDFASSPAAHGLDSSHDDSGPRQERPSPWSNQDSPSFPYSPIPKATSNYSRQHRHTEPFEGNEGNSFANESTPSSINQPELELQTKSPELVLQKTHSTQDGRLTARISSPSTSQARMIPTVDAIATVAPSRSPLKKATQVQRRRRHSRQSRLRRTDSQELTLVAKPSSFTMFEKRLAEYVNELFNLGVLEMTPDCYRLLRQRSVSGWVVLLAHMSLDNVQILLGGEDAPTVDDFLALSPIENSYSPGVYIGVIITDRAVHDGHDFIYVGSATAPGRGLQYRVGCHLDPKYRQTEKSKGTENFHYAVVDEEGKGRVEHFRKLGETEFTKNDAEHISDVRFACVLLEQIMMAWTRSLASSTSSKFPNIAKMSPWETVEYVGTNRRIPLRQPPPTTTEEAPGITREERLRRDADMAAANRARMTAIEKEEHSAQQSFYSKRVLQPVLRMKRAGVSLEKQQAFKAEARREYRETKKRHLANSKGANVDGTGKSAIMATIEELTSKLSRKTGGSDLRTFFKSK